MARRRFRGRGRRARRPGGVYNVADDEPPTRGEVSAALAAAVGRPHLQLATDAGVPDPMGRSLRLSNRRLRAAGDWAPRVRAGLDGWSLIVAEEAAA